MFPFSSKKLASFIMLDSFAKDSANDLVINGEMLAVSMLHARVYA